MHNNEHWQSPLDEVSFELYTQGDDKFLAVVSTFKKRNETLISKGLIVVADFVDKLEKDELVLIAGQIEQAFLKEGIITENQRMFISYNVDRDLTYDIILSDENKEIAMKHWGFIVEKYGEENFIVQGDTFILVDDFYAIRQGTKVVIKRILDNFYDFLGTSYSGKDLEEIERKVAEDKGSDFMNKFYDIINPNGVETENTGIVGDVFGGSLSELENYGLLASLKEEKSLILRTYYIKEIDDFEFVQENNILMFKDISEVAEFVGKRLTNGDLDLTLYTMENKYYLVVNYPQYMSIHEIYTERVRLTEYMNFSGRTVDYLEEYGKHILGDEKIRGVLETLI